MIILKQIVANTGGGHCVLVSTSVSGIQDGSNQTFATELSYISGRITVDYNGQSLNSPNDFLEIDPNTFQFIYIKPDVDDVITATYETTECDFGNTTIDVEYFTDLLDTPDEYRYHGGDFVRVRDDEAGLEFVAPRTTSQEGVKSLTSGTCSEYVAFPQLFSDSNYVLNVSLENLTDPHPNIYPFIITNKTMAGFYLEFAGDIDSNNYNLNWQATVSGAGIFSNTMVGEASYSYPTTGLSTEAVSYYNTEATTIDKSTEEDIYLGNSLIMTSTTISGGFMHGYIVGWSGEAAEMNIKRNDSGFACPLHMRSDGAWYQCTAVSGTNHMPCAALALQEGEGSRKKILWKGIVRKDCWNWTPGDIVYVSTVAGALTKAKPRDNGEWVQPVGIALKRNVIRFDPGFNPGYVNSEGGKNG